MSEVSGKSLESAHLFKYLNSAWQFTGAILAPVLFTLLFIQYTVNPALNMYQWLLWLHLPILMIHEFEEYLVPGGFKDFFNKKTIFSPEGSREDGVLNEAYIFLVNPVLAWPWAIIGAFFYRVPWIGFALIIFQFAINNFQHVIAFQLKNKGYNPGLITTLVLLIPYCTFVTWYVVAHNIMTMNDWILAVLLTAVVFGSLLSITLTRRKHAANG